MEYVVTISTGLINPLKLSGYFIYHEVLTFTNSTFCPHSVFICFLCISKQTVIISLYSINWLVFVTEMCVYCAARVDCLTMLQGILSFEGSNCLINTRRFVLRE
jgi:hypothetical protein